MATCEEPPGSVSEHAVSESSELNTNGTKGHAEEGQSDASAGRNDLDENWKTLTIENDTSSGTSSVTKDKGETPLATEVTSVALRDGAGKSQPELSEAEVRAKILIELGHLKERIEHNTEIPDILLDVPLKCLQTSTIQYLSYHLDPESDIMTDDGCLKDYRGLAEKIGLETVFIKFITRANYSMLKTKEVLSKWLTLTEPPLPTLKNLQKFLKELEREDVLEDMAVKMAKDAVHWKITEYEAKTNNPKKSKEDTSWQLTRHDVVSGKKTMYTAGLVYADEDELMAQLIIKLYKKAHKDALFFIPNFDLKTGKYVLDTTAKVISERCDHKVVFLLSEYFYASSICQFAVSYAAANGTGNGNLIPFHLTRNTEAVPNVLKGIAGIRWFRKGTRRHTWTILTDSLLSEKIDEELLVEVKDRITKTVERDPDVYLQDPPYDENVEPPGAPYPVVEPEGSSSMPPMCDMESMNLQLEQDLREKSKKWKLMKQMKKVKRIIEEKVFKVTKPADYKPCSSPVEMKTMNSKSKIASDQGASGGCTAYSLGDKDKNKNKEHADKDATNDKTKTKAGETLSLNTSESQCCESDEQEGSKAETQILNNSKCETEKLGAFVKSSVDNRSNNYNSTSAEEEAEKNPLLLTNDNTQRGEFEEDSNGATATVSEDETDTLLSSSTDTNLDENSKRKQGEHMAA